MILSASRPYIAGLLSLGMAALLYHLLFQLERTAFEPFIQSMGLLFLAYGGLLLLVLRRKLPSVPMFGWQGIVILGIALRILAWLALPELSDDYFRFIWDGRLYNHGVNPFLQVPQDYMADPDAAAQLGLTQELYDGLNSPAFFTIYPPVLQGIFILATALFPTSIYGAVLIMKLFILLAEMGTLFLLIQMLKHLNLRPVLVAWYALNPLVIVELCGNCHFEGLMICFLLASIWLLWQGKTWLATVPFALAVCTKLLPLMLLPLFLRRLGWGRAIAFGTLVGSLTALMFLPIFDLETLTHMLDSVELYFANFEFNASVWYLIKALFGDQFKGNPLATVGSYLGMATLIFILLYAFLEPRPSLHTLPKGMLWVFLIYLSLASVVHPWYVLVMVALASVTPYRFPMVWTLLLPLTYYTYRTTAYEESLLLVLVEYGVLLLFILGERWWRVRKN